MRRLPRLQSHNQNHHLLASICLRLGRSSPVFGDVFTKRVTMRLVCCLRRTSQRPEMLERNLPGASAFYSREWRIHLACLVMCGLVTRASTPRDAHSRYPDTMKRDIPKRKSSGRTATTPHRTHGQIILRRYQYGKNNAKIRRGGALYIVSSTLVGC